MSAHQSKNLHELMLDLLDRLVRKISVRY